MGQSPIQSSVITTIEDENGNTFGVPFIIFNGLNPGHEGTYGFP